MGQSQFSIRAMTAEDIPEATAIQETIIQGEVSLTWREGLRSQLQDVNSRCLVAEQDGRVVGFVISNVTNGAFGADRAGWLGWIGVRPRLMGQGVGRALAQAIFDVFQKEGVNNIYTAVRWDSTDMLSFFKSLGFDRSDYINLHKQLDYPRQVKGR